MRITYNNEKNLLSLDKYGRVQFQRGSLNDHKRNGILDTELISGLANYLESMDDQHKSIYTETALENLHSAFLLLDIRRSISHAKYQKRGEK